jgi:hypothetical protein
MVESPAVEIATHLLKWKMDLRASEFLIYLYRGTNPNLAIRNERAIKTTNADKGKIIAGTSISLLILMVNIVTNINNGLNIYEAYSNMNFLRAVRIA